MEHKSSIREYRGFPSLTEQHRYDNWKLAYTGRDYKDDLLEKSLPTYVYNNPNVAGALKPLNNAVVHLIMCVKYIHTFFNYAVPKGYNKIS